MLKLVLLLGFAVGGVLVAAGLKKYQDRLPRWSLAFWDAMLIGWVGTTVLGFTYLFADLSGITLISHHYGIPSAALISLLVALLPSRAKAWGASFVGVFLCLLVWGDLVYLRVFGTILPADGWQSAAQIWDVRDSVTAFARLEDIGLLVIGTLFGVFAFMLPVAPRALHYRERSLKRGIGGVCLVVLIVLGSMEAVEIDRDLRSERSWMVFDTKKWVRSDGIVHAHLMDLARTIRESWINDGLSEKEVDQVIAYYRGRHHERPAEPWFGVARGMNVIFVQVEALQNWVIDTQVSGRPITPFLNSLRQRALYFPQIVDQTGSSPTADSEYAILNSQHPLQRGAVVFRRATNDFLALPHVLRQAGYKTLSAHAFDRGFWNRAIVHRRYGFSVSHFDDDLGTGESMGWGLADHVFFDRVIARLPTGEAPYFAFLITLTSHHPYSFVPKRLHNLSLGGIEGSQTADYIHSVHYADQALAGFFDSLESASLLANTMVVIYGDHDANLSFGDSFARRAAEVVELELATVMRIGQGHPMADRVPLFVALPESQLVGDVRTVGGHVDVAPTVLHLMGLETPAAFLGRPILPGTRSLVVRLNGAVYTNERIFLPEYTSRADQVSHAATCWSSMYEKPLSLDACQRIRSEGSEQLEYSWKLTLNNLAHRINQPAN